MDLVIRQPDLAAHRLKSRTGIVGNILLIEDAAADLPGQIGERLYEVKEGIQAVPVLFIGVTPAPGLDPQGGLQGAGQIQQLGNADGSADFQAQQASGQVADAGKRDTSLFIDAGFKASVVSRWAAFIFESSVSGSSSRHSCLPLGDPA